MPSRMSGITLSWIQPWRPLVLRACAAVLCEHLWCGHDGSSSSALPTRVRRVPDHLGLVVARPGLLGHRRRVDHADQRDIEGRPRVRSE